MKHAVHVPVPVRLGRRAMVTAVDQLASAAGITSLHKGGSAADAAVATSAVLSVTTQHLCGMGGDLLALVAEPGSDPAALVAAGRAGSGADSGRLRAEGAVVMPFRNDIRSVPVPGCVDGWLALHERFGRLPLAEVLAPAVAYARDGFPASPLLADRARLIADLPGGEPYRGVEAGTIVRRPGVARTLESIARDGRDGFYRGEFGRGLVELGRGEFTPDDLARPHAEWRAAIGIEAWGHRIWSVPAPSQGYLTLAGAWIASGLDLPDDPDDPQWAHLLIEAAKQAGYDREELLHADADVTAMLDESRLSARRAAIGDRSSALEAPAAPGGTIHLNVVDGDGLTISCTQSNAAGFGAHIVEPGTGIFLQNRGLGFNLRDGHAAEYAPGRRPPHTLSPAIVTTTTGRPVIALGTMGADSQPQILLQLLARMLAAGQPPEVAVAAPRWILAGDEDASFAVWRGRPASRVKVEANAPPAWIEGLRDRGHVVELLDEFAYDAGHAHAIVVTEPDAAADTTLRGASDPRVATADAIGW
ncbi:MAG: gamma-glutamyltranspeptidase [Actinomycetia bacterium]|nr:gamma-glutamyltranspeptidase [Actinomycetes bacterium]